MLTSSRRSEELRRFVLIVELPASVELVVIVQKMLVEAPPGPQPALGE